MERAMELEALGPASPEARAWAARAAPDDDARQALYGSETLDDALHALARMLDGERPAPDEAALALAVARAELPPWAVDEARKRIETLGGEWGAERKGRDGGAWRLDERVRPDRHACACACARAAAVRAPHVAGGRDVRACNGAA